MITLEQRKQIRTTAATLQTTVDVLTSFDTHEELTEQELDAVIDALKASTHILERIRG